MIVMKSIVSQRPDEQIYKQTAITYNICNECFPLVFP